MVVVMDPLKEAIVVYDGSCPICQATMAWVMRRALPNTLRPVPCQSEDRLRLCPQISEEDCMRAIHLVLTDGRVLAGDRALPSLFRLLNRWRWVAIVLELPVFRHVSPRAYAWFATNRFVIARLAGFCRTGSPCEQKGRSKSS